MDDYNYELDYKKEEPVGNTELSHLRFTEDGKIDPDSLPDLTYSESEEASKNELFG